MKKSKYLKKKNLKGSSILEMYRQTSHEQGIGSLVTHPTSHCKHPVVSTLFTGHIYLQVTVTMDLSYIKPLCDLQHHQKQKPLHIPYTAQIQT